MTFTQLKEDDMKMMTVLVAVLLALPAMAAPNPNALGQAVAADPNAVQPAPAPPPVPSKFGGCVGPWVCFQPSLAIAVGAINLRTKTVEGAFAPGVGYGFTVHQGQWWAFGADVYFTLSPAAQQASISVLGKLFNGYFRPGWSKGFIGDTAPRFLFATGVDIP